MGTADVLVPGSPELLSSSWWERCHRAGALRLRRSSKAGFLHAGLLGWIGSVTACALYVTNIYLSVCLFYVMVHTLLPRATRTRTWWSTYAVLSCEGLIFFLYVELSGKGESQQAFPKVAVWERALASLFPSQLVACNSPTSGPWFKGLFVTVVCLLSLCLVGIQPASSFFLRRFHLLFHTTSFSLIFPVGMTLGCMIDGCTLAVEEQVCLNVALGSPSGVLMGVSWTSFFPCKRKNATQAPWGLSELSVTYWQ